MTGDATKSAFKTDARGARVGSALKAAWWGSQMWLTRKAAPMRTPAPGRRAPTSPPPPEGLVRAKWAEAFDKEAADVAAGLYPLTEPLPRNPVGQVRQAIDLIAEARAVAERRVRKGGVEVREAELGEAYPAYYRQNFHFQTGGWFTDESARRYEAQVELLFTGAAGPMRRRALSLLARAWKGTDHRRARIVDVACGSGSFLRDLKGAFPRAAIAGLDLSRPYLTEARRRARVPAVQAAAERLPFADASLDAVTCVYLFHELPPRVRPLVAAEIARVLKPGGLLAFADSVQRIDEPELGRLLEAFPAFFHEPFYDSYQDEDLAGLFTGAGLRLVDQDKAFLTKALLFEKA